MTFKRGTIALSLALDDSEPGSGPGTGLGSIFPLHTMQALSKAILRAVQTSSPLEQYHLSCLHS